MAQRVIITINPIGYLESVDADTAARIVCSELQAYRRCSPMLDDLIDVITTEHVEEN